MIAGITAMEINNLPLPSGFPSLKLLGTPQVGSVSSLPTKKLFGLLAYLALEGPTWRNKLAYLLWSDAPEEKARHNLRQELYRLKSIIGDGVRGTPNLVELNGVDSDAVRFREAMRHKRWAEAIGLYSGPLLEGLGFKGAEAFEEWLEGERLHLERLYEQSLLEQAQVYTQQGKFREALHLYQQLLRRDSLREDLYRQIIQLHMAMGDRGGALAQLQRCKRHLLDELGVDLLPETLEAVLPLCTQQFQGGIGC